MPNTQRSTFAMILDPFVSELGAGQLQLSLPHHGPHGPDRDWDHALADSSAAKRGDRFLTGTSIHRHFGHLTKFAVPPPPGRRAIPFPRRIYGLGRDQVNAEALPAPGLGQAAFPYTHPIPPPPCCLKTCSSRRFAKRFRLPGLPAAAAPSMMPHLSHWPAGARWKTAKPGATSSKPTACPPPPV